MDIADIYDTRIKCCVDESLIRHHMLSSHSTIYMGILRQEEKKINVSIKTTEIFMHNQIALSINYTFKTHHERTVFLFYSFFFHLEICTQYVMVNSVSYLSVLLFFFLFLYNETWTRKYNNTSYGLWIKNIFFHIRFVFICFISS